MRVLGYCTRCRRVRPVKVRGSVGRVTTGLCAGCEERSNRPTDLTIYAASAIVGRALRRGTVEAAWEPNRGGRTLAHLESALGRAADLLLRGAAVRRVTAGTAELQPVGVYDARNCSHGRCDLPDEFGFDFDACSSWAESSARCTATWSGTPAGGELYSCWGFYGHDAALEAAREAA